MDTEGTGYVSLVIPNDDPRVRLQKSIEELAGVPGSSSKMMINIINEAIECDTVSDQKLLKWITEVTGGKKIGERVVQSRAEVKSEPQKGRNFRRQRYATLQKLWKKNERAAVKKIFDNPVDNNMISVEANKVLDYFEGVFSTPSVMVECEHNSTERELAPIWNLISAYEVQSFEVKAKTSPGLDGIRSTEWRAVNPALRAAFYNVIMAKGRFPGILSKGRTILISKKSQGASEPQDFRPITITSVISRQFSKILAGRLEKLHNFDERQRAFLPLDGCAENLAALNILINKSKSDLRELHIASVDIAGAFDSVSHSAVLQEVRRLGAPVGFVEFLASGYKDMKTLVSFAGESRSMIVKRGVRQGDPLSPLLFNMVVDKALKALDPHIGYRINENSLLNALVFADDTILIASTNKGLQINVNAFSKALMKSGMRLKPEKCATLSLKPSGREKKMKVLTDPQITLDGKEFKQLSTESEWKYLGLTYHGNRLKSGSTEDVTILLDRLSSAPLKPQQRLRALKVYLLPKKRST